MLSLKNSESSCKELPREIYYLSKSDDFLGEIVDGDKLENFYFTQLDITKLNTLDAFDKSMLMVGSDMAPKLLEDVIEKRLTPKFYMYTMGDDVKLNTTMSYLGHFDFPIKSDEIVTAYTYCNQKYLDDQEKKDLVDKLESMEKISLMGHFTSSLVHDLNNYNSICMVAFDGINMINDQNYKNQKLAFLSDKGMKGSKMINSLAKKYHSYLKNKKEETNEANLNFIINETINLLFRDLNKVKITYKVEVPKNLIVYINEVTFTQIIINLVKNSIFAIQNQDDRWIVIRAKFKKDNLTLYVIDSGKGIDDAVVAKMFDPLYTTKGDKGTGIGLGFCKRELSKMGLDLKYVKSENTVFAVEFPLKKFLIN